METLMMIAGLGLTILNIINLFALFKTRSAQPMMELSQKVRELEDDMRDIHSTIEKHAVYLSNDNQRFVDLEKDIKTKDALILKALHTLIRHARTGNNVDELAKADDDLNNYLFEK